MTAAERQRRRRAGLTRAHEENNTMHQELRKPAPLPVTRESLIAQRRLKSKRTINDLVEDIVMRLWPDQNFMKYLDAIYDSETIEGSRVADDFEAARIIRDTARKDDNSEVGNKKLDTIVRAMKVAQRRYGIGRQQRYDEGTIIPTSTPAANGGDEVTD